MPHATLQNLPRRFTSERSKTAGEMRMAAVMCGRRKTMYCSMCGKRLSDVASFCPYCGARLAVRSRRQTAGRPQPRLPPHRPVRLCPRLRAHSRHIRRPRVRPARGRHIMPRNLSASAVGCAPRLTRLPVFWAFGTPYTAAAGRAFWRCTAGWGWPRRLHLHFGRTALNMTGPCGGPCASGRSLGRRLWP